MYAKSSIRSPTLMASQEQVTAAVGAALEQRLTTVRRIRGRSDEAGDRAALRIERALGAAAKP